MTLSQNSPRFLLYSHHSEAKFKNYPFPTSQLDHDTVENSWRNWSINTNNDERFSTNMAWRHDTADRFDNGGGMDTEQHDMAIQQK